MRRSLQVTPGSAGRLLRCGQSGRCRDCGNPIEWYHRSDPHPVPLHPHELPAAQVPEASRWHVSSSVAHPAGDGSSWCRLPHAVLCPARDTPPPPPELAGLRRALAVRSRRLIDAGTSPLPRPHRPARRLKRCSAARDVLRNRRPASGQCRSLMGSTCVLISMGGAGSGPVGADRKRFGTVFATRLVARRHQSFALPASIPVARLRSGGPGVRAARKPCLISTLPTSMAGSIYCGH
ncbi:DUF6083 domain-containing protein [Streptomyces sp. LUP47B]|uniref:DUF6083 domain-containing protein n=1 Tax=Streptomyces sp. LUP47B TaxID=1890286 RepID=UPI00210B2138|nr:DUF6083 domain-containing protein [Streptomyces sp. LUP47B]